MRRHAINSYDDLMERVKILREKFEKETGKSPKATEIDLTLIDRKEIDKKEIDFATNTHTISGRSIFSRP